MKRDAARDCPRCGAIAPAAGEIEHAWDCLEFDAPLAPLKSLPKAEKIRLLDVAREIEIGWEMRRHPAAPPQRAPLPKLRRPADDAPLREWIAWHRSRNAR